MQPPSAPRLDIVDTIHGHQIADPYRWLEDAASDDTRRWSEAQDELARTHLSALPGRAELSSRLLELLPGYVSAPYVVGERSFFMCRDPKQEHAVLLVREGDGEERVLIDPSSLSEDHTVTLDGWSPSKEGNLLAYLLSEGGDEESVLRV